LPVKNVIVYFYIFGRKKVGIKNSRQKLLIGKIFSFLTEKLHVALPTYFMIV